ncbi:chloride channel protein [Vibrio cholerae]|nr:chloride channel protein [Vibrio cholerae]
MLFNYLITLAQDLFVKFHRNDRKRYLLTGSMIGDQKLQQQDLPPQSPNS